MLVATKLQRNQDHEESRYRKKLEYYFQLVCWLDKLLELFFSLLLKINKVVEMTIDSQINLLIHGIDCFFG